MNSATKSRVASILSHLPIDLQDVLVSVAERGAERNREEIRSFGSRLPQCDHIDMEDLRSLLGRYATEVEQDLVAQCMRAIAHENPSEVDMAERSVARARQDGDALGVVEAERWLRQARHEATLTAGTRVKIARGRMAGTCGAVVGADAEPHVFEVQTDPEAGLKAGLRVLVSARDLETISL